MKSTAQIKRKQPFFRRDDMALYVMSSITVFWLILFRYMPMLGLTMAFQELNIAKGIFGSDFVGLRNFEFLFSGTDAWLITRNTVVYSVVFLVFNLSVSVTMALLLSELRTRFYAKTLQTIYMLPHFLSWAVIMIIVTAFLSYDYGLLNKFMISIGSQTGNVDFYKKREFWPPFLVFMNAWKNVGYQSVLYLAVISGISHEYYEAAVIDGANKRQQAWYITIPHLRLVISISLIMAMGNIFGGDFGLFFVVTKNSGKLYPVTDIIDTYIYRSLTSLSNVGMATAAGLYQSVAGLIMLLIANKIVSKIDSDSAMF